MLLNQVIRSSATNAKKSQQQLIDLNQMPLVISASDQACGNSAETPHTPKTGAVYVIEVTGRISNLFNFFYEKILSAQKHSQTKN